MSDSHFGPSLRRRLRLAHAASPTPPVDQPSLCNHRHPDGTICGAALDARGHHAGACGTGGGVVFGHNAIRDWLAEWLEDTTGHKTDTEQWVSAWNWETPVLDPAGQPVLDQASQQPVMLTKHARLDVAFRDSEGRRSFVDVAVVSASSESAALRARRACEDGVAAADAVRGKRSKYPAHKQPECPLVPFVIEALGRLSPEAHGLLRSVAPKDPTLRSRALRRATQTLSVLVQSRLAEQLLSAEAGRAPQ